MEKTKPFEISYQVFEIAFERVKANKGSYGIDEQTIKEYEENLQVNLSEASKSSGYTEEKWRNKNTWNTNSGG